MRKVRSKLHPTKIGVIKTFSLSPNDEIGEIAVECTGCTYYYNNLAELCEKWEDYEEPKYFYCIAMDGRIYKYDTEVYGEYIWVDGAKQIGNYFETEEEALAMVEKLKAWKRLKDKGFRIEHWRFPENGPAHIEIIANCVPGTVDDINLLFGGDDE